MKNLKFFSIALLLVGFCFSASGQIWQNFKGIRLVNISDTTDATVLPVEGSILYAFNDKVFYGRTEWGWKPFGGGGGITGATNGLQMIGSDVGLGGFGTQNTSVDFTGFDLEILAQSLNLTTQVGANLDVSIIGDGSVGITATNNGITLTSGVGTVVQATAEGGIFNVENLADDNILLISEDLGQTHIAAEANFISITGVDAVGSTPLSIHGTDNFIYDFGLDVEPVTPSMRLGFFSSPTTYVRGIRIEEQRLSITSLYNFFAVSDDPVAATNGDVWYNTTTNKFRARENGANVNMIGGGGITNTATNTELAKSDGTNLIPSGVFIPSNGNLTLGSASIAGNRTILVSSSTTNANLIYQSQGTGIHQFLGGTSAASTIEANATTGTATVSATGSAGTLSLLGSASGTNLRLSGNNTVEIRGTNVGAANNGVFVNAVDGQLRLETSAAGHDIEITATDDVIVQAGTGQSIQFSKADAGDGNVLFETVGTATNIGFQWTPKGNGAFLTELAQNGFYRLRANSLNLELSSRGATAAAIVFGEDSGTTQSTSITLAGRISSVSVPLIITAGHAGGNSLIQNTANDMEIDVGTEDLILNISRTSCTGAPSGAIANVAGVLNICP